MFIFIDTIWPLIRIDRQNPDCRTVWIARDASRRFLCQHCDMPSLPEVTEHSHHGPLTT